MNDAPGKDSSTARDVWTVEEPPTVELLATTASGLAGELQILPGESESLSTLSCRLVKATQVCEATCETQDSLTRRNRSKCPL